MPKRTKKTAKKGKAPAIPLRSLPRDEQGRVLLLAAEALSAAVRETSKEILSVTVGIRRRGGTLRWDEEPVLRVWVARKVADPIWPVPRRVFLQMNVVRKGKGRGKGDSKTTQARVSIPTDVLEVGKGTGHAEWAEVGAKCAGHAGVVGCLAARVSWAGGARGWVSAGHVATSYATSASQSQLASVSSTALGYLGDAVAGAVWFPYPAPNAAFPLDAGLVAESRASGVDSGWIAGGFAASLTYAVVAAGLGKTYCMVHREGYVDETLKFHGTGPAKLAFGAAGAGVPDVHYPLTFHFTGLSHPGDSGTCVFRKDDDGTKTLVGILAGRLDGPDGDVIVVPFDFALQGLRAIEPTAALVPFPL